MPHHQPGTEFSRKREIQSTAVGIELPVPHNPGASSEGPRNSRKCRRPDLLQPGRILGVEVERHGTRWIDRMYDYEKMLQDGSQRMYFEVHNTITGGIV